MVVNEPQGEQSGSNKDMWVNSPRLYQYQPAALPHCSGSIKAVQNKIKLYWWNGWLKLAKDTSPKQRDGSWNISLCWLKFYVDWRGQYPGHCLGDETKDLLTHHSVLDIYYEILLYTPKHTKNYATILESRLSRDS